MEKLVVEVSSLNEGVSLPPLGGGCKNITASGAHYYCFYLFSFVLNCNVEK